MGTKKKILIIDDEQEMLDLLRIELEQSDYQVMTALEGLEGLELARTEKPDIVLLDVMMPKMDGFQVCRILKFDENYKDLPIVMLSAKGQKIDQETGKEVHADAYVTKPFDSEVLLETVKNLLKD